MLSDQPQIIIGQKVSPQQPIPTKIPEKKTCGQKKVCLIILGIIIGVSIVAAAIAVPILITSNQSITLSNEGNTTTSRSTITVYSSTQSQTVISKSSGVTTIGSSSRSTLNYSTVTTRLSSTVITTNPSNLVSTNYSGSLTVRSNSYDRNNSTAAYYYDAIQVSVPIAGIYSFKSVSSTDMYGSLYINNFDPLNSSYNLVRVDDDSAGSSQFLIQGAMQINIIYTLVVTTYSSRTLAVYSIVAQGSASVNLFFMNDTSTTTVMPSIPLITPNDTIYGLYNTFAGGDSIAATPGSSAGNYPFNESPNKVIDNDVTTKYLNFGACPSTEFTERCGKNTGFYLTLQRGPSVVIGFQICTANDVQSRDPVTITLEGSNAIGTNLNFGTSWNLIYNGSSGLSSGLGRNMWGARRYFTNSIQYTSYRFLVTSKRLSDNSVQYSEVQFYGP